MGGRTGLLGAAAVVLAATLPAAGRQADPGAPDPAVPKGGRDVFLSTSDGIGIAATHWRPTLPSGAGAVLLPMYRRDRTSWHPVVDALRARGIDVLAIDPRGHGGSAKQVDGDLADRVANRDPALFNDMHRDAYAAVRWLVTEAKCDPKRIGIAGASVGCSVAIDTARRHPSEVAAVVCLTPGANYLGVPSLEHAKTFPAKSALLLMTHAEEADVGARALAAAVKHARLLVHDERRPADAEDGWAHGTRMFGRLPLAEQTVASFLAARTGSRTDDVVLDGLVGEEAKPGGAWTKATRIPIDAEGCSAWAYRVGARLVFGGTAPRGLRAAKWTAWTEVELGVPEDGSPDGLGPKMRFPLSFVIDVESGSATSWTVGNFRKIPADAAARPTDSPLGYGPPLVRVTRTVSGFEYEGEFVLRVSRTPDEAPPSDPLVTVELTKDLPPMPEKLDLRGDFQGEGVPVGSR